MSSGLFFLLIEVLALDTVASEIGLLEFELSQIAKTLPTALASFWLAGLSGTAKIRRQGHNLALSRVSQAKRYEPQERILAPVASSPTYVSDG